MIPKIKTPCNEDWDKMRLGLISRHCEGCKKEVIDFTGYTKGEILTYLLSHQNESICGRVRKSQLDFSHQELEIIIENILNNKVNYRYAFTLLTIASLILSGCNNTSKDPATPKPVITNIETAQLKTPTSCTDSVLGPSNTLPIPKELPLLKCQSSPPPVEQLMGEIVVQMDEDSTKNTDYTYIAEVMPEFIGGPDSLITFIRKNLVYPEYEAKNLIEGTVYVSFTVEIDGKISNPAILKTVQGSKYFDAEVIRVINLMPPWKPGERNGNPIAVKYNLPFKFKL